MNWKYIYFIFFLGFFSCKKEFLETGDRSVILRQEYVTSLSTVNDYLNGIYVVLGSKFYLNNIQTYPDLIADDVKPRVGSTVLSDHYNWAQKGDGSSSSDIENLWRYGYQLARSCSFVLEKADEYYNQDEVKADNMKAQAFAIRGLVHFVMVSVFAQSYNFTADASHPGIPYVTTSDYTQPLYFRNSVGEVYTNIIRDLNAAIPLFSNGTTNILFLNKHAAKALLARAYLFKEDFVNAKNYAVEVGKAVPIMVGSNYPSKLFTPQETEALFQLFPATVALDNYTTTFQARYFTGTTARFLATTDIANLLRMNPQDVRRNWIKSGGVGKDTIIKFPINVRAGFTPTSESYYPTIIRSSEMYLTAAESFAKLNIEDSARYYLDAIVKRSNPSFIPSTATGTALLDSIYLERRKELAFEGFRMFDLLRWKKGVNRTDAIGTTAKSLPYPSNKAIAPLPKDDVQIAGLIQNLGY